VTKKHEQRQSLGILGLLLLSILFGCPSASALDPRLDISQYAHTSWRIRDGFTKGIINSIAQTPDGYLWLGTEFGLYLFDGVRAVTWQPPLGQSLASSDIRVLLAARDGTLWIGTAKGLASWKDGKLTNYPELADLIILRLLEDHQGTVWAGAYGVPAGRLCAVQKGSVQCYGEDGGLGPAVVSLFEDSKGNLWVGVRDGLWRWKPGPLKFYALQGETDGVKGLAEESDGSILIGWKGGIYKFVDGKTVKYPAAATVPKFQTESLLWDRDGALWVATNRGLLHVHRGRTDVFSTPDGLSSDRAHCLFEDREGTMWVATLGGLDRFRDSAVSTLSTKEGLSNSLVGSVLAAKDGRVWLGTYGGLNSWFNGQISSFGRHDGKVNGHAPSSLFQDSHGRIWFSTFFDFGYLQNEKFVSIHGIPAGNVHGIGEDFEGSLWIANKESGLLRLSPGNEIQEFQWSNLKPGDYAIALAVDPLQGGLWLGFSRGGIAYFADGKVRRTYTTTDGLGEGQVASLRVSRDGTLWAATEGGLSRLKNGRIMTLTSKNGLPCATVHWSIEDDARSLWLYMECGLVRIMGPELSNWIAAVDKDKNAKRTIQSTVFDDSDGVRVHTPGGYSPSVAKSTDGRLWFLPWDGVSVVDPRHLPFNKLPPPVYIQQITADGKTFDPTQGLRLPPRVQHLDFDYTALSLVAPEKNRFRFKLEGYDRDWRDVGNRRQAFYTNLRPRKYRFVVKACNNSGVWNETGAFLDFSIAPAYYQTNWFRALLFAAVLGVFWALHQIRMRRLAREFNAGLEARVNERTRIARELHDTLLQSFQGLLMRFQAVSNELAAGEPKQELDEAISRAARAITEGRDAVQGLRSSAVESNDLAAAIGALAKELPAADRSSPEFTLQVEGAVRKLHPVLRDEVYRVAGEALRNAFHHADAEHIEVEIRYDEWRFRLRVRDDGKGIDPKHLAGDGRAGHFGLHGMRERANRAGGELTVWSELQSGTEVELSIPAARAYRAVGAAGRGSWLARKLSGKDREMGS
jgi:signal transduction histidine kinase/ligand-binding sensor domain-containing protein